MRSKQSSIGMDMDQAEGLRRLLVRGHSQVISVLAGKHGVGRTSMINNLAAVIAGYGKQVLVLDENRLASNVNGLNGSINRYDFLDVVQGKCKLHEALYKQNGFAVLSTKRAINLLSQMKQAERLHLDRVFADVSGGMDVILVDAAMPNLLKPLAPSLGCQKSINCSFALSQAEGLLCVSEVDLANGPSLLLVVDATVTGITDSYAMLKRLAKENPNLKFEIVINKVADEQIALKIFGNMAKVATRNHVAKLVFAGCIPFDEKFKTASQRGRSVIDSYPSAASTKSYLALCKNLLCLDMFANDNDSKPSNVMQNLMKQFSQPLQKNNERIAQLVS